MSLEEENPLHRKITYYLVHQNKFGEQLSEYFTLTYTKLTSLENLLTETSQKLGFSVMNLYSARSKLKILEAKDINEFDVGFYSPFPAEESVSSSKRRLSRSVSDEENPAYSPNGNSFYVKMSILGNGGIGKSALTLRYAKKNFLESYEKTLEEEYEKRVNIHGHNVDIFILDTAGQEEFYPLRNRWISGRDAFIIASSVEDTTIEEITKFHDWIETYHSNPDEVVIALIITKVDLPHNQADFVKIRNFAVQKNWQFAMTSAKEDLNVDESFTNLIAETLRIKYGLEMSDDEEIDDNLYKQESIDSEIEANEKFENTSQFGIRESKNISIEFDLKSDDDLTDEDGGLGEIKLGDGMKDLVVMIEDGQEYEGGDEAFKQRKDFDEGKTKKKGFLSKLLGLCCLATD